MIEAISGWVVSVLTAAFLCAVAYYITPEGKTGTARTVKFVSSLIVAAIIVIPVSRAISHTDDICRMAEKFAAGPANEAMPLSTGNADKLYAEWTASQSAQLIADGVSQSVYEKFGREDFEIKVISETSGLQTKITKIIVFYGSDNFPVSQITEYISETYQIPSEAIKTNETG
ncbi:hypothetical protein SDC9_171516 [bioreactor metagenome]|uniref:Stage III sporulation protein AF n=1 Tax=bioreactor metagenome TaxID=1076179 RepID=A0A645GDN8_9ZZZZ|nr:hypothetical protein [Oscillospiraceae bacterium]